MIRLCNISSIYFIGIGGIGMSALARYFNSQGVQVKGYDKTPSPLTAQLEKEGIQINFEDSVEALESNVNLVVYTPAIPENNTQLSWYKREGYVVEKRATVLGAITHEKFTIAVAGSHGKTTVSSMIAHILNEAGGCTAFLGGIATNFESNYIHTSDKYIVVEADEYDRSFMTLSPNIAVITAIDCDHLEIYGSLQNIEKEFIAFTHKIEDNGTLFINEHYNHIKPNIKDGIHVKTYGYDSTNNAILTKYDAAQGLIKFDVKIDGEPIPTFKAHFGGIHNVENATVAIAVCKQLGINDSTIAHAIISFKGIKRRFEKHVDTDSIVYIDDYAHHPDEIKALVHSIQYSYPNRNVVLVFQPHLYSRTQNLYKEFAKELSRVHHLILLPIYPARERPIAGVSSQLILDEAENDKKELIDKERLLERVKSLPKGSVLLTVGAGDIDRLVLPIKECLNDE